MQNALKENEIETDLKKKALSGMISKSAAAQMREYVLADPSVIGTTVEFRFLTNGWIDGYLKGRYTRESVENSKFASAAQFDLTDILVEIGFIA